MRDDGREGQDAHIRADEKREVLIRHERRDQPASEKRHTETKHAAEPGEQHAFGHELPDQATPSGPERHTNGDLPAPYRRARQEQIRDVGARDEQDQRDDDHQHQ